MPGRIWAGSPAGSGRGLRRALDIAPRFPYSAQERRCLWGGPAMLLMHFSFVSVFPVDSGRCPVPRRRGEGSGRGREDAAAPEHLTGDDMTRTFLALIFLLLTAVACPAGQHPLTVTRTADDFYAAFDRDILIKTKFCSVRAFQEKALLRSDLFGELVFMDGTRCSVDTVYVRKRLRWGTHKVTVTREEEGIYSLAGSETLLFASRCSTLALRDEAVLEMQDSLSGILHLHGGTCRVERVFEAISY